MKDYLIGAGYVLIVVVMCVVIALLLANLTRYAGYNPESVRYALIGFCTAIATSLVASIMIGGKK